MSAGIDSNEDKSMPYWKAVIATLSPEKRDAAWEFYLKQIGNSPAGNTLSGLILLLEANGIFMQTLPADFASRLIQPMEFAASTVCEELRTHTKTQEEIIEANKETLEEIGWASTAIQKASEDVTLKIQEALQHIKIEQMAESISTSLETSTLAPLRDAVKIMSRGSSELENCSKAAKHSVELWRKVHVGGMFLWALASAIVVSVIICGISLWKIRGHYEKCLADFTNGAGKTAVFAKKLQEYGIAIEMKFALDSNGAAIPGTYAIHIPRADDFHILTDGTFRTAIVHVKPGEKASSKPATIK